MRVCIITPRYPPDRCGVGDYTALLARHLARRGLAVTVITSRWVAPPTQALGVRVLPLIEGWGWAALPRLASAVRAGRYDVVHIQYQNEMYQRSAAIAALPLALRAAAPRTPTVLTVHDYGTPWPRRLRLRAIAGPYGKLWFAAMLAASRRVVLTNEQDAWRFTRQRPRYPIPAARYAVIPVGSNLPVANALPTHPDGLLRVGYFGFVNPAKGVESLLDGFAWAYQRLAILRLIMVCALRDEQPYHQEIRQKINTLGLEGVVTVTGELADGDAAGTLASCDMVALPFRDGLSLRRTTLVAALALGRPVISTRAAVPPAALHDGRDVLLAPPGDAAALGAAILDLAGDPARRAALGDSGRHAATAFAWPSIAAHHHQLYEEARP